MGGRIAQEGRPWQAVWGKTERDDTQTVVGWLPLHQHLADAAGVAGKLVDEWLSPLVVARIASELARGVDDVRALATWLAAIHDVGKASPAFVSDDRDLAGVAHRHGLAVDMRVKDERSSAPHAIVGNIAVRARLRDRGLDEAAGALGSIVGSHHGVAPERTQIVDVGRRRRLTGDAGWERAREEILDWADEMVGCPQGQSLSLPAQVLLSAVVIIADWIASDTAHFPTWPRHSADEGVLPCPDACASAKRLEDGWSSIRLPARWRPVDDGVDAEALMADRFERPEARPVQRAAVATARSMARPGLVIVEAPMGEGKTEAALLAAEILAARSGADGCFVALPTRATSDAMFSRVLDWVERVPGWSGEVGVRLAHGTASLNADVASLPLGGRLSSIGDEGPVAHMWFQGRKRAVLAQFVVGTVDQVLFAAVKSKHVMLRHLGLAGKVVVIDEVHAYDTYMAQFLHRALHWLGAYGTPVVLLSATLPAARRAELVAAYDSGAATTSAEVTTAGYPSITTSGGGAPTDVNASGRSTTVTLTRHDDDLDGLVALLEDRLRDGGCAVVVRNTVTRVQHAADRLVAAFGADAVTVNHSRFLACDRARIDVDLLRRFGPPGPDTERPPRHVVVASQVVEQSLDVDFDVMVSDLAPIDLLLQRMGRLHRHHRARPARVRTPECVVVGVEDWDALPARAVRGSRYVYVEHTLLRAAALVRERSTVTLPVDIPDLVEAGYGEAPLGPDGWQLAMATARAEATRKAEERRRNARTFLLGTVDSGADLVGWMHAGVGEADDPRGGAAQVRDGQETLEVVVVQGDGADGYVVPDWISDRLAGTPVATDFRIEGDQARALAACVLRLPLALSHPGVVAEAITVLEKTWLASFEATPLLRGSLVLALGPDRTTTLTVGGATYCLAYSEERGLTHEIV